MNNLCKKITVFFACTVLFLNMTQTCIAASPAALSTHPSAGKILTDYNSSSLKGVHPRLLTSSAKIAEISAHIQSDENIKKWWAKGYVPIKKSGYLPDPDDDEIQETLDEINSIDDEPIDVDKIKKKAIPRRHSSGNFFVKIKSFLWVDFEKNVLYSYLGSKRVRQVWFHDQNCTGCNGR